MIFVAPLIMAVTCMTVINIASVYNLFDMITITDEASVSKMT